MSTVVVQNCGNAGLYAIKALLAKGGVTVRTSSRNPSKLKDEKLKNLDVEVFNNGDDKIFEGATAFICIPPGPVPTIEDRAKISIEFLEKAAAAGVSYGVVMSVQVANPDNRRTLFGKQFGDVIDFAKTLEGVSVSIVAAPFFLDNLWGDVETIKTQDAFYAPADADLKLNYVAVSDIGDALATAVADSSLGGRTFYCFGDFISKADIASTFSAILGREIKFVVGTEDAATEAMSKWGMPKWQIDGIFELLKETETDTFIEEHKDDFNALVGRAPMTAKQYIENVLKGALSA